MHRGDDRLRGTRPPPAGQSALASKQAQLPDSPETLDRFGATLSVGDFDNTGSDELVIGVPGEDLRGMDDIGAIHVLYNFGVVRFRFGPASTANQFWDLGSFLGDPGVDPGDLFGATLPLARFTF